MRLHPVDFAGRIAVEGYGPGFFRAGGAVHRGAVLILPGAVLTWSGPGDSGPIVAARAAIDLLLLGTGSAAAFAPEAFRATLAAAGIACEAMATPAACRTFNVLLAEGRRVGAALLPV